MCPVHLHRLAPSPTHTLRPRCWRQVFAWPFHVHLSSDKDSLFPSFFFHCVCTKSCKRRGSSKHTSTLRKMQGIGELTLTEPPRTALSWGFTRRRHKKTAVRARNHSDFIHQARKIEFESCGVLKHFLEKFFTSFHLGLSSFSLDIVFHLLSSFSSCLFFSLSSSLFFFILSLLLSCSFSLLVSSLLFFRSSLFLSRLSSFIFSCLLVLYRLLLSCLVSLSLSLSVYLSFSLCLRVMLCVEVCGVCRCGRVVVWWSWCVSCVCSCMCVAAR